VNKFFLKITIIGVCLSGSMHAMRRFVQIDELDFPTATDMESSSGQNTEDPEADIHRCLPRARRASRENSSSFSSRSMRPMDDDATGASIEQPSHIRDNTSSFTIGNVGIAACIIGGIYATYTYGSSIAIKVATLVNKLTGTTSDTNKDQEKKPLKA